MLDALWVQTSIRPSVMSSSSRMSGSSSMIKTVGLLMSAGVLRAF